MTKFRQRPRKDGVSGRAGSSALAHAYPNGSGWRAEMAKWYAARNGYTSKRGGYIIHSSGLKITAHGWLTFYRLYHGRIWAEYDEFSGEAGSLAAIPIAGGGQ